MNELHITMEISIRYSGNYFQTNSLSFAVRLKAIVYSKIIRNMYNSAICKITAVDSWVLRMI